MNIYTKEAVTTLLTLKADAADLIIETTARADADTTLQTNINKKQDKLTFDTTPTTNSTNPVISGGIKTYVDNAVSSVYKYKGSVATYADLPTTDLTTGDVYNVEDTGDNYAWTGTAWDKLAGTVDLSAYLTTATAENTYAKLSSVIDVSSTYYANSNTQLNGLTINGTNYKLLDVKVNDGSSLIIGNNRELASGATGATAIGACESSSGGFSTALGYGAKSSGGNSVAIGNNSRATSGYSTCLGNSSEASGSGSTAIGNNSRAIGSNSVALGNSSTASGKYSTTLGDNSVVYVPNWVSFDGTTDDLVRTVSLKSTDNIFFRNENVDASKTTQESYTSGKTLTQILDTKQDKSTFATTDLVFYNSDDTVLATVKVYSK